MKAHLPPDSRKTEIARIAAHLAELAQQQGPLLFLAELEAILGTTDDMLTRDLSNLFCQPTDVHPRCRAEDWQAQERLLAALVTARMAA